MDEKKIIKAKPHNISIEGREKLQITGVTEVDSFNDNIVSLNTEMGGLTIKGNELHINKLNVDDGNLIVEGYIISCVYTQKDENNKQGGLLSKIFK